jgi:hypothetical protein
MPADESKTSLVLEFEEFQRKLEAAARLTRADFEREEKSIHDLSFSVRLTKACNAVAEKSHVLLVPDADDPERSKEIKGRDQRDRLDGALWSYLEALLARMRSHIRDRFKPVAAIARKSSSADLLSSNLLFREALHSVPHYITTDRIGSRVRALCDFWGRPEWTASFDERFRLLFAEEWERLVCEAELDAPLQPSTFLDDARSRVQPSESAAVDQRTRQIGDRVVSSQPPQAARRSQSQSPRDFNPRKALIAKIKSHGENSADRIAVLMDAAIEKISGKLQPTHAPLDDWKELAPEARTWKEFLDHEATRKLVRNYINKVHPLSSEISKKAN